MIGSTELVASGSWSGPDMLLLLPRLDITGTEKLETLFQISQIKSILILVLINKEVINLGGVVRSLSGSKPTGTQRISNNFLSLCKIKIVNRITQHSAGEKYLQTLGWMCWELI